MQLSSKSSIEPCFRGIDIRTGRSRVAREWLASIPRAKGYELAFPRGLASPEAEILITRALRRTQRANFSDLSFVAPLNFLLMAYAEEANLSSFGRSAMHFDLERSLVNLLRLDIAEEENPSILDRPIRKPIFITGMPRSASSFLHMLLSLDPSNRVPRCWQTMYPYPGRRRFVDLRKMRAELEIGFFNFMAPGLCDLHQLSADAPQECTDITAQIFQSLRFETTYRIPSYQTWIDKRGHREAFLFHRRFLQHLDVQTPGHRWVLKCPDHVFALGAIMEAYPDAEIVFLHRDPVRVVSSCAKLTELLRRPFATHVDLLEVGEQVTDRLIEGSRHMINAARRFPKILHLNYREVVANPMVAISTLYRHCGIDLGKAAEQRMKAFLQRPRHSSARRYDLGAFGVDPSAIRDRFAPYVQFFAVSREAEG